MTTRRPRPSSSAVCASSSAAGTPTEVSLISLDADGTERIAPFDRASAVALVEGRPVREFRMHKGQKHWSGSYWCATTGDLEAYESRLELARLMLADHDPEVADVLPQPFTLRAIVDGKPRRHVPDFLFLSPGNRATVVDVKLASRVSAPKVAPVLAWTRRAVEDKGWTYEVWSGAPDLRLANVRFLAGYRVAGRIDPLGLDVVRETARPGMTVGEALVVAGAVLHRSAAKPALLHLLWLHELGIELDERLTRESLLLPGTSG